MHLKIKFVRVMPPAPPCSYTKMDPSMRQFCYFVVYLHFGKNAEGSAWMANNGETQTHVPALRWATLKNELIPPFLMSASLMQTLKQAMAAAKGKFASITLLIINMNSFKDTAISSVIFHNTNPGSSYILIKRTQEMWPDLIFLIVPWQLLRDTAGHMEMHKHSPSHYFCLEKLNYMRNHQLSAQNLC